MFRYIIYNIVTFNTTLYLHLKPSCLIHNMYGTILGNNSVLLVLVFVYHLMMVIWAETCE
jgi:hypothetical protein